MVVLVGWVGVVRDGDVEVGDICFFFCTIYSWEMNIITLISERS